MRPAKACSVCRERRRKCDIPAPGSSCVYCSARRLDCNRKDLSVSKGSSIPEEAPGMVSLPEKYTLPNQPLCIELVELYFDYVHDKFHSLFHRPSLIDDIRRGATPEILIYGILALSARFSNHSAFAETDPRERGKGYAKKFCVLLGAIAIVDGNAASETIYYSIACRIAQLLDLPNCHAPNRVEQEVNTRVWWTLCMIDVWSSTGVRLPRLMIPQPNISLPMNEVTFLTMTRAQGFTVLVSKDRASSLLAQMVLLNRILSEINDFNIKAATTTLTEEYKTKTVAALSEDLNTWLKNLPVHMHDTPSNLQSYASQGQGQLFVTLYLGYYHYGQMLFYRFLHEDVRGYTPRTHFYAQQCKEHAVRLCEIIYRSEEVPGCDVLYSMVGHVLVIASTVQIHTLLFGDEESVVRARARLEKNFVILTKLRALWPTLDICMERLQAFHRACRSSVDTSFCMDAWMVRFLVEFANPISDKHGAERPWALEEIGIC